jgi:FAD/FMN-containing dehydrogenase
MAEPPTEKDCAMTTTELPPDIVGATYRPGDPGYAEEVAGFNLAVTHTPDLVVAATCPDDVVAAVGWARERGLPVAVQATGHGSNIAVDGGVLISTRAMRDVAVDPDARTATVAAGATWRDVLDATAPHGLTGLNGSTTGVGVVGYTLGGGLPVLGRAFGFATDRVRSFDVVTPDGVLRHVDADHEPELFWALRGGKGAVGIVTSLVCELVPVSRIYGGAIFYPGEHAEALLRAYAEWTATLPDETCTAIQLLRLPPFPEIPEPIRGQFVVHLCVAHVGDPDEGARLLAPMRAVCPPVMDLVEEMDYADVDRVYQDPDHPVAAAEGCLLLPDLSADTIRTLLELAGPGVQTPLVIVGLRHLGGALARPPAVEDAVGARDAAFLFQTIGMLAGPHAADVPAATAAAQAAMAPYSNGRTMVNLHGTPGDDGDRARAWTPDHYARLRALRARLDPTDMLRFGHALTTSAPSGPSVSG